MKHQKYYPNRVEAQPEWLENFAAKLPTYATPLGLAAPRVTAAVADARWLAYVIGQWIGAIRSFAQAGTDVVKEAETGPAGAVMVLPTFTAPDLPTGVAAQVAGALSRLFTLVKDIKNAAGYTLAIGTDLGVIGPEDTNDHPVPRIVVTVEQGATSQAARITFYKYGHQGVHIESRRSGGAWEFLAVDTESPYLDDRALLAAGQPEVREYRARYWDKGAANGDWTDVVKATVAP